MTNPLHRLRLCFIALCLVAGCGSSKPQELILGKWDSTSDVMRASVEFKPDGTVDGHLGPVRVLGSYRLTDDGHLEMDVANQSIKEAGQGDGKATFKLKYQLSRNELITTDPQGTQVRFKRVR